MNFKKGFTLLEMLIVICIIGIISGFSYKTVKAFRKNDSILYDSYVKIMKKVNFVSSFETAFQNTNTIFFTFDKNTYTFNTEKNKVVLKLGDYCTINKIKHKIIPISAKIDKDVAYFTFESNNSKFIIVIRGNFSEMYSDKNI